LSGSGYRSYSGPGSFFHKAGNSDVAGHVWDGSIGLGYLFDLRCIEATPFVGYSYQQQQLHVSGKEKNLHSWKGPSGTGKISDLRNQYHAQWQGPWIGLDLSSQLSDCFRIYAGGEFHWACFDGSGKRTVEGCSIKGSGSGPRNSAFQPTRIREREYTREVIIERDNGSEEFLSDNASGSQQREYSREFNGSDNRSRDFSSERDFRTGEDGALSEARSFDAEERNFRREGRAFPRKFPGKRFHRHKHKFPKSITSFSQDSNGTGFIGNLGISYTLNRDWALSLLGNFQTWSTSGGKERRKSYHKLSKADESKFHSSSEKMGHVHWRSFSLTAIVETYF
jgi:hypothetical protein